MGILFMDDVEKKAKGIKHSYGLNPVRVNSYWNPQIRTQGQLKPQRTLAQIDHHQFPGCRVQQTQQYNVL